MRYINFDNKSAVNLYNFSITILLLLKALPLHLFVTEFWKIKHFVAHETIGIFIGTAMNIECFFEYF